jgi:hypothetical protein
MSFLKNGYTRQPFGFRCPPKKKFDRTIKILLWFYPWPFVLAQQQVGGEEVLKHVIYR